MKKEYYEIVKINVTDVNKDLGTLSNLFGSAKRLMEQIEVSAGLIGRPNIYAAIPKEKLEEFKKVMKSKFKILGSKEMTAKEMHKCILDIKNRNMIKDQITETYSKEFPEIKYVSDRTAAKINKLNKLSEKILSIDDLKAIHHKLGKKVESGNKEAMEEFEELTEVVDDMKHAKLTSKQEQIQDEIKQNPRSRITVEDLTVEMA